MLSEPMKRPDACRVCDRVPNYSVAGIMNQPAESLEENAGVKSVNIASRLAAEHRHLG